MERQRQEREEMYGSGIESLLRARSAKHRKQLDDLQRIKDRFLQVRPCRHRSSLPVDLGYRGVRGAVGLGYRFTA